MIYTWSLSVSSVIFLLGILYRFAGFFQLSVGPVRERFTSAQRITGFVLGGLGSMASPVRVFRLFKTLILDVLLQFSLLIRDPIRWLMHVCIFWGFAGLFFFHALEDQISYVLFSDYASTLNPFMALRNILGVMVFFGLSLAIYRRKTHFRLKQLTRKNDYLAIILLAVIMGSGFLLEASKIVSAPVFDEMMEEWGDQIFEDELPALKAYWQEEFNVKFPGEPFVITPEILEEGELLHDNSCLGCHVKPQWAFVSYPISVAMWPLADFFNSIRLDKLLLIIHFLSCFVGMAYLPFSKFLHILTSPVSLLIRGVVDQDVKLPENRDTRRAFDIHACTQCGACTSHCAVAPVHEILGNQMLFPSERVTQVRESASGRPMSSESREVLSQGSFICTLCNKCSMVCPAGMDLQDIWTQTREQLSEESLPDPAFRIRELSRERLAKNQKEKGIIKVQPFTTPELGRLKTSLQAASFSQCYTCLTCTNSCPVVAASDDSCDIGSAPHQVIHCLSMGMVQQAMDASMIWNCLTCYMCQENCPEGVRITDIFYELKNMAYNQEFGS